MSWTQTQVRADSSTDPAPLPAPKQQDLARRDFSSQPSFLCDAEGVLSKRQNAATVDLVWWWGGKESSW